MTKGAMSPLVVECEWSSQSLAVGLHEEGGQLVGVPTDRTIGPPLHELDHSVGILAGGLATGTCCRDCFFDFIDRQSQSSFGGRSKML